MHRLPADARQTPLSQARAFPPREIHESLNVVENWNSANGFVFFGKGGEIATNRGTDQEVSSPALHLVQASLVYVNTRMVQSVPVTPTGHPQALFG